MIPEVRKAYNDSFSEEAYSSFLEDMDMAFGHPVKFRVAESPVFVPPVLLAKLRQAGDEIIQTIKRSDFKSISEAAIPAEWNVPNEDNHSRFLALDFAVCQDQNGEPEPQLIELQGFPSLFAYQDFLQSKYREYFNVPDDFTAFFGGIKSSAYKAKLKETILGIHDPKHVVLLEVEPEKQNTAIDFFVTRKVTGVEPLCISKVIREGKQLFYERKGVKTQIKRIYNRVIVDEFAKRTDLKCQFNLTEDVDVEWVCHPNWFFRISKYIMPYLQSSFVPWCDFLSNVTEIPADLENYVLKPLFSFSGAGVIFHVTEQDILSIPESDRKNFLLQRKVNYAPLLQAPDGGIKVEIRLLYFWPENQESPDLVINLSRLSRGELIGVKYNKDKTWVGGSVCFFPPEAGKTA
ncbi:MAG: hypothetical protein R2850_05740 [Bacteroidia bacterium]